MRDKGQGTLTINGRQYPLAGLSVTAKKQLTNLRVCDNEIVRLKAKLAITQTARKVYAKTLDAELGKNKKLDS